MTKPFADYDWEIGVQRAGMFVLNDSHLEEHIYGCLFTPHRTLPMPKDLIESELFGHEKGAFTGAHELKIGKFEQAHMGTLFLDEIGEMDVSLQAKLLRAIEEGEIERLGGSKPIKVDIRLLAATNCHLRRAVAERRFREDLYFRLNVLTIGTPPLRDRLEDVPTLALHFISLFARKGGRTVQGLRGSASPFFAGTVGRATCVNFGMSFDTRWRWALPTSSSRRIFRQRSSKALTI